MPRGRHRVTGEARVGAGEKESGPGRGPARLAPHTSLKWQLIMETSEQKTGFCLPGQGTPPKPSAPAGPGQWTEVDEQRKHPPPPHHSPSRLAPPNRSGRFCKEVTPGTGRVLASCLHSRDAYALPRRNVASPFWKQRRKRSLLAKEVHFPARKEELGKKMGDCSWPPHLGSVLVPSEKEGRVCHQVGAWTPGIDCGPEKGKMPFLYILVSSSITRW